MKNPKIHTLVISVFLAIFGISFPAQAQIIESEWNTTDETETLKKFPKDLQDVLTPKILVSPNPTSDNQVSVWYNQLKEVSKIIIYDAAGKLYHTANVGSQKESKGVHRVPVSRFSSGVYIVKLKSGIYESVAKFVIR